MTSSTVHALATASGPAAPPRKNGELVFEAPWQSRAFGLAIALHDAGAIDFEEFRERLIAEIAAHELEHGTDGDGGRYYEHWLDALQHVVGEQQLVAPAEIGERAAAIAHAWAHDHDHQHEHGHEHAHAGEHGLAGQEP
jgi:nitrile hydratase accessory protein